MSQSESSFHWYTPLMVGVILAILMIIGPTVLVPAWFLRSFASRVPVWDPDRRWDGVKGYAVLGSIAYALLAAHVLLFVGNHLDLHVSHVLNQTLVVAFDFSPPALFQRWSAGLLLTCVFALSLEHSYPYTDREPIRVLTEAEKHILEAREAEHKRQELERQRLEEAEKQRQAAAAEVERKRQQAARDAAVRRAAAKTGTPPTSASSAQPSEEQDTLLDPTKLDQRTFWERVPEESPAKQLAKEEVARNQFLADQAAAMHGNTQPKAQPPKSKEPPKSKREKRDKGDGSMNDLL